MATSKKKSREVGSRRFTKATDLFAFWSYGLFPYVLGGKVVEMDEDGCVRTEEYGGMTFKPIKLMPRAAGEKLMEKIKALRAEQYEAEKAFHAQWLIRIHALVPFLSKGE